MCPGSLHGHSSPRTCCGWAMGFAVSCDLSSTHCAVFNAMCAHGWTPCSPASLKPKSDPMCVRDPAAWFGLEQAIACGCPSNDLVQQVILGHAGSLPVRRGGAQLSELHSSLCSKVTQIGGRPLGLAQMPILYI